MMDDDSGPFESENFDLPPASGAQTSALFRAEQYWRGIEKVVASSHAARPKGREIESRTSSPRGRSGPTLSVDENGATRSISEKLF